MFSAKYLGSGAAEGFPGLFCECPACARARLVGGRNIKTRSCTLINGRVLVDLSPDIFAQSARERLPLSRVSAIVFTHTHSDHLDLPSLMLRAKDSATILPGIADEENVITVYGGTAVGGAIERGFRQEPSANRKRVVFHEVKEGERFEVDGIGFAPIKANHMRTEACYIYGIDDGRASMLYANDTGSLPEEAYCRIAELGRPFDVVSMDCARGILPGDGHMGISENREMVSRLKSLNMVHEGTRYYLNHFSHMSGLIHDDLQKMVEGEKYTVTYDGLSINVGREG